MGNPKMYKCLKKNLYTDGSGYHLAPIHETHIELIRQWRNDQTDILRQNLPISEKEQTDYFKAHIWPTFTQEQPKQLLFSYFFDDHFIGYGGLTHIDWINSRAEISFLLETSRNYNRSSFQKEFKQFLTFLCCICFDDLHFHRLFAETYATRHEVIQTLENFGFSKEGVLRDHVQKNGVWIDSVMHGLLIDDYLK